MRAMRTIAVALAAALAVGSVAYARGGGHSSRSSGHVNSSSHIVSGYTRSNGTNVSSYHATDPNRTRNDNYSTRGNTNPYTGAPGTKPRDGEH